ncbi:glycerate kinase type-2 family protein [Candidatus Nitrospira bockiana]
MDIAVPQPRVRALLVRLLTSALQSVDPGEAIARMLTRRGAVLRIGRDRYDLSRYRRIAVIGAGKASARMAAALEQTLGPFVSDGLVVVKYGHRSPTNRITIVEAAHPVPDAAGVRAARKTLALVNSLTADDLVFVLLSGGASSLWPAPAPGLSLADKQRTTDLLLRSGATIHEINSVRKHLSAIKGGRLAAATQASVISLVLSDVLGDDLGTIGSGPTAPDPSRYTDAITVLKRRGVWSRVPPAVRSHLLRGRAGKIAESPKPGDPAFRNIRHYVVANNRAAVETLAREATRAGMRPLILSTTLIGEAREAAKWFGALGRELCASNRPAPRPACLIAGGELTVTIRGPGRGGRAQEFALAAAREIAGLPGLWVAAFGTDGTDGPNEAAGAVVSGETWAQAVERGLDPDRFLQDNDSYAFFTRAGGHVMTGPTGTNVNDLYLLIAL